MARRLRIELPGGLSHVVSRGNRGQKLFVDDEDRRIFLRTLEETCGKTQWQVYAYCLLADHVHLLVRTPEPNLSTGIKWMLGTYAARVNRRHQLKGHLFANRYRSLIVESAPPYLQMVSDYVHLNPARAGRLSAEQTLAAFEWSSLPALLSDANRRPRWLRVNGAAFPDTSIGRQHYARHLEALRMAAEPPEFSQIRRGWCFGSERFRRKMALQIGAQAKAHHYGMELREAAEAKAEMIVRESLKAIAWKEGELSRRAKGDLNKLEVAHRLRRESTVTLDWIAQRLQMGTRTYLAHLLYWDKREPAAGKTRNRNRLRSAAPGTTVRPARRKKGPKQGAARKSILLTDPNDASAASSAEKKSAGVRADLTFDPSFD
jgi:putative transposase